MAFVGIIVLFLSLLEFTHSQKPEICDSKDPDFSKCLSRSLQSLIPILAKGIPKLGIFPMDPLHIDVLDLSQSPGKTINVRHKFTNVDLAGLGSAVVNGVKINLKDLELDIDSVIKKPVTLTGDYVSSGNILSLPIRGEGAFNITLDKMKALLKLKGHKETKNGKVYIHIDSVKFPFTVQKLILDFENLFKGNKEISDNINRVLNDNWKAVLDDMQDSFEEAIGEAFKEIGNRAFSKIPLNELIKE